MAHEQIKDSTLTRALSEVVADLADLLQKEMRLARAELSAKLSTKLQVGVWIAAAGLLGLIAAFLVVQAAVFAIASFGIALHWSCLIVAAVLAVAAAVSYQMARADANESMAPTRTLRQVKQDIATAKEHLT